jgi:hypothetical protein
VARSGLPPAELERLRAAVERDISGMMPATERDDEVLRASF